jgi:hypothetical protein
MRSSGAKTIGNHKRTKIKQKARQKGLDLEIIDVLVRRELLAILIPAPICSSLRALYKYS